MKKQTTAAVMAAALLVSVTACGKTESEATSLSTLAGQTLTGTVSAVSAEELALDTEASGTVTIPLSEDTVFQRDQPGMGGGAPGGETPPEKPDGESTDSETPPEKPEGDSTDSGTPPAASGEGTTDGGTPPEKPTENPPTARHRPKNPMEKPRRRLPAAPPPRTASRKP